MFMRGDGEGRKATATHYYLNRTKTFAENVRHAPTVFVNSDHRRLFYTKY